MSEKKFIGFYCTHTQAKKIQASAKREGRPVSEYIRRVLLNGLSGPTFDKVSASRPRETAQ